MRARSRLAVALVTSSLLIGSAGAASAFSNGRSAYVTRMVLPVMTMHAGAGATGGGTTPITTGQLTCTWSITNRPAGALYQIVTVHTSQPTAGVARVTYLPTGAYVGKWINTTASLYTGRHGVPATPTAGTLRVTVKGTVVCKKV